MKRKFIYIASIVVSTIAIAACSGSLVSNNGGFGDSGNPDDTTEDQNNVSFPITALDGSTLHESLKSVVTPTSHPELFVADEEFSEEFDGDSYSSNWTGRNYTFETVSFDPSNLSVENGNLEIVIKHYEHDAPYGTETKHLYFQSGLLSSSSKTTYGFYEARIKGSAVFNGTCPAFWLYNVPWEALEDEDNKYENKIVYNEIDVIELQQVASDFHIMSTNYHMMVLNDNGAGDYDKTFVRPDEIFGENESLAEWDSRDDYHIYACESRPDSLIWYIDNQRVASIPNYFWHLPVNITLSMEPRTPFETWIDSVRYPTETTAEEAEAAGFPCTMSVDYIRTWRRTDYSEFESAERNYDPSDFPMTLE